jgi:hypothetical protein
MSVILAIFVSMQAFVIPGIYAERLSAEEAAERASKCELGLVTVKYDAELQSQTLVPAAAGSASDEQLTCINKASSSYSVELPPPEQIRFDAIRLKRFDVAFEKYAREWLAARGILDRVPKYEQGITNDAAFAREIEKLCGPRARGAFHSRFGPHTLSPDWLGREVRKGDVEDVMGCLMSVSRVAGFDYGFIGNEAASEAK